MFVQDNLENIEVVSGASFPNPAFLLMSIVVGASPIILFAIGGGTPATLSQTGLVWALLAILSFLPFSADATLTKLRSNSYVGASRSIHKK